MITLQATATQKNITYKIANLYINKIRPQLGYLVTNQAKGHLLIGDPHLFGLFKALTP